MQEIEAGEKKRGKIKRIYDIAATVLSIFAVVYFGIFSFLRMAGNSGNRVLSIIILIVTIAYVVLLVVFLIIKRRSRKKMRKNLKQLSRIFRFVRYFFQLVLLGVSIASIADIAIYGQAADGKMGQLIGSVIWTVFLILFEIGRIFLERYFRKLSVRAKETVANVKQKAVDLKRKADDIKQKAIDFKNKASALKLLFNGQKAESVDSAGGTVYYEADSQDKDADSSPENAFTCGKDDIF